MVNEENEYVLGTGGDELSRLALQHRVWADATTAVWKRAGVGPGAHVLDLGCGPGYTSFDLAQLVTESGRVLGVDASENFVDYLTAQAKRRELTQVSVRIGDAENLQACLQDVDTFDVIYCRWLICWLAHPEKAVRGMVKALRPGGRLIVHDYFNWQSMTKGPRSVAVDRMVQAAVQSFRDRDGDVDVASRLPKIFRDCGLEIKHFDVHQRVARGGGLDSTVAWPLTWWRTYAPKLVQMGKLSQSDCSQALSDLNELERNPDHFFFCPPLFEFICTAK